MKIRLPENKFNNPMGEAKLDELIDLLNIESIDTIVDFGGGNGAILLKLLENSQAKGILLEKNQDLLDHCRNQIKPDFDLSRINLITGEAKDYLKDIEPASLDCIVCIGSSHIFDGYMSFVEAVLPFLKTNGLLLMGEGFWMQKPSTEYLELLGGEESELMFHFENIEKPEHLGLTYLYSQIASEADWNRFEGNYFLEEEFKARQLPQAQQEEKLKGLRNFRKLQYRLGRSTMGFGLYLFEKQF